MTHKNNLLIMQKRLLFIMFLLAGVVTGIYADNDANALVVNHKSGTQTVFAFAQKPIITFRGEALVINSNDKAEFTISMADVKNYTFGTASTGIDEVKVAGNTHIIKNGHVVFKGMKAGQTVSIYSVDGKLLNSVKADGEGIADIELNTLSKGIFIVKCAQSQIKINNK